jgi:hypothetical protein
MSGHSETVPTRIDAPSIQAELASEPLPTVERPVAPRTSEARFAGRDSYAVTAIADITDRSLHAAIARFTAGLSPAALAHASARLIFVLTEPNQRIIITAVMIRTITTAMIARCSGLLNMCRNSPKRVPSAIKSIPHRGHLPGYG